MKVVLLCGGQGKRMFPLTEDKVLLKFLGKTLLEHQIETACQAGLRDYVIICHTGNIKQLQSIAAGIQGIKVEFALQKNQVGIAGALQAARHLLSSPVIVVNPNDLFEVNAYKNLLAAGNTKPVATLLAYEVKEYFPGGYLMT
ncbi:MAG: sugar phosphate nucleotidyltransferase, partial [Dehalococcoidales bacterium]|nr:sugar phosphate nucleotidyltransferase [Dehalococcoidales bacterium]